MEAGHLQAWTPVVVTLSIGVLVMRLVFGAFLVGHGVQKLFGWLGGEGPTGSAGYFEGLGFYPGRAIAILTGATEAGSGLLLALGLLGPIGPALVVSLMIVALVSDGLPNGLFWESDGIETPLLYMAAAFALALIGPGIYSLDALLGLESLWTPVVAWVALAIGVAGGVLALAVRRATPGARPA